MRFWIISVGGFHTRADVLDPTDESGQWFDIPVYVYLAETADGLILFDTGCSETLRRDPYAILGADADILSPRLTPEDHVVHRLGALGFQASDISVVAVSHLHFDHAGGNDAFPAAEFWIQRAEWEAAASPDAAAHYPDPAWRPRGHALKLLDGDQEITTGLRLMATPGHTPGHQSLLVDHPEARLLITSDAVYKASFFDPNHVGASWNRDAARASVKRLRELAQQGWRPFFSHDPEQHHEPWVRLAPAGWF
jgi:N-acyl homoserine lactone hydrolase